MNYYVKAIGKNKNKPGTDKWLKIRDIWSENDYYVIEIKIRNEIFFARVGIYGANDFVFGQGWPPKQITWGTVLKEKSPIRIGKG